jgi:hypothetical protein
MALGGVSAQNTPFDEALNRNHEVRSQFFIWCYIASTRKVMSAGQGRDAC